MSASDSGDEDKERQEMEVDQKLPIKKKEKKRFDEKMKE